MRGIIIGGGIGGLCAAQSLQRVGIDVRVYEAAPVLKPVGAGIMMAPNAMRVFENLGIADAVEACGVSLKRLVVSDQRGRVLQAMEGRVIEKQFGNPITAIHRADLHRILLERIEGDVVRLGRRCVACHQTPKKVVAMFQDGSEETGDFLIGADGLRSVVRRVLFPSARLRYSGQTCWRGVSTAVLPGGLADTELWGCGLRVGFLPIGGGKVYWYATANRDAGGVDDGDARGKLLELFRNFAEPVPSIIEQSPPEAIVRHDLYDLRPMSVWSSGRITLLGDAAHAPTPNLGQGGAQAVEDAWVLVSEMGRADDPAAAFRQYESRRKRKANRIIRESRRFGWIAAIEHPALCTLRNRLIRWTPEFVTRRHIAWVFRAPAQQRSTRRFVTHPSV